MNLLARTYWRRSKHVLVGAALVALTGCSGSSATAPDVTLGIVDLTVGTGATVVVGSLVTVNYTAWLQDTTQPNNKGQEVATTVGGSPFQTYIGLQQVIEGWDLGLPGMKVGGVRELTIPPELAYGTTGSGSIPPNATLIYDITLLSVQ